MTLCVINDRRRRRLFAQTVPDVFRGVSFRVRSVAATSELAQPFLTSYQRRSDVTLPSAVRKQGLANFKLVFASIFLAAAEDPATNCSLRSVVFSINAAAMILRALSLDFLALRNWEIMVNQGRDLAEWRSRRPPRRSSRPRRAVRAGWRSWLADRERAAHCETDHARSLRRSDS